MSQALRTERAADPLNLPPWRENAPCPVSLNWFNRELLKIGGAEPNGTPHYRAVWGQDLEASMIRDRYEDRFVPRYIHNVIRGYRMVRNPTTGLTTAAHQERIIGTPRVYVEAFLPADVVCRSGTSAGVDSDGDHFSDWWPAEGDWMPMIEICKHDDYKLCCRTAFENDRNCHGWFRGPDQRDVETVAALWQAWQKSKTAGPNDPPNKDAAALAFKYAVDRERERHSQILAEMNHNAKTFFKTHSPQLSDDPGVAANGKYHFLGNLGK